MNLTPFYIIYNFIRRKIQKWLGIPTLGVKALVINKNNEILLVKHTYSSGWYLPGGGVDRGESYHAAIKRELKEEVGICPTKEPVIFGIYIHSIFGAVDYPIAYIVTEFEQVPASSPEIAASMWVKPNAIPEDTTPGTRRRIDEYFNNVVKSERW